MAKVLIIEDDRTWQEVISEAVEDVGGQPYVAGSYGAALAALLDDNYALAIVDVSLSMAHHDNQDGVQVLRQISRTLTPMPTIVVTGFATVDLAIEILAELKAVNIFRKDDFNRRKFIATMTELLPSGFANDEVRQKINPTIVDLFSNRELEVLYRLSLGQTNKEIAEELYISVNTVKKHVQSIFIKLEVNSRAAAVNQAFVWS